MAKRGKARLDVLGTGDQHGFSADLRGHRGRFIARGSRDRRRKPGAAFERKRDAPARGDLLAFPALPAWKDRAAFHRPEGRLEAHQKLR